jgi:hypothetical protein
MTDQGMPTKIPARLQRYCTQYVWEHILKHNLDEIGLQFDSVILVYEILPLQVYSAYVKVKCTNYLDPFSWKCAYVNIIVNINKDYKVRYSVHKVEFDSELYETSPWKTIHDKRSKN